MNSTDLPPLCSAVHPQPTNDTQPTNLTAPLKGIINDSSFAVVSNSEGDRHVFFQDQNGTLMRAEYKHLTSSWSSSTYNVAATDARELTPLSACTRDDGLGSYMVHTNPESIHRFLLIEL